eukprot:Colp12_sorted_trinity150504_noHs@16120
MKAVVCLLVLAAVAFAAPQERSVLKNIECDICEYIVASADNALESNRTVTAFEKVFDGICNKLPLLVRKPCVNFVNTHADQLLDAFVEQRLSPEEVCPFFRICEKAEPFHGPKCSLCQLTVQRVLTHLDLPAEEAKIVAAIDAKVCSGLPNILQQGCENLINKSGELILQAILQEETKLAKPICIAMKQCSL